MHVMGANRTMKIILLTGVVILIFLIIIFNINNKGIYVKDYYAVVNFAENNFYESVIVNNGPIKEIKDSSYGEYGYGFREVYTTDGRNFVFGTMRGNVASLCRIEVTGTKYRFGRYKIGVGTSKNTIEKIYRNARYFEYEPDGYLSVVDGAFEIDCYFDEDDNVYKITVGKQDFIHY
jgi:hypothetical protein